VKIYPSPTTAVVGNEGDADMELYLIRHADALPIGEQGITTDEERPLSEKGQAQAKEVAKALLHHKFLPEKIFVSPLVRTTQTANIILHTWSKPEILLEPCELLAPDNKPRKLGKFLLKQTGERLALVGHMPLLGDFAAWLLGSKELQVDLAKAGVARIDCGEMPGKGLGVLRWIVTPEWY
jgi:phosphohistidine phosphatase